MAAEGLNTEQEEPRLANRAKRELMYRVLLTRGELDECEQRKMMGVCSTRYCKQPILQYCTQGCHFLCQQCYDRHTRSHNVISIRDHRRQLGEWSIELEKTAKTTDTLIDHVKRTVDETKRQMRKAESDISDASDKVKSTFKKRHDNLDKNEKKELSDLEVKSKTMHRFESIHQRLNQQEKKIVSELQEERRRTQTTAQDILDSQLMTMRDLQFLKTVQIRLAENVDGYDYQKVTQIMACLKEDVEGHFVEDLRCFSWRSEIQTRLESEEKLNDGRVYVTQTEMPVMELNLAKVALICIHDANDKKSPIEAMVVYKQHVYTVRCLTDAGLIVYSYTPDGSPGNVYRHKGGEEAIPTGMCFVRRGDTAMLVVSDSAYGALVWIKICDDFTMKHNQTQLLDYQPYGPYNEGGILVVCDPRNHKIHRYSCGDVQSSALSDVLHKLLLNSIHSLNFNPTLSIISGEDIITLPDDVRPNRVTRRRDEYVIIDRDNHQIVMIDEHGHIKTRYKDEMHGEKLEGPFDVITD